MLLALLAVESMDIVFAVDSVPAVLAVTTNIFIAYTSNIFAILGMRAPCFLLILRLLSFTYLPAGLAVLLFYLGKIILSDFVKIPTVISLLVVGLIPITAIAASATKRSKKLPKVGWPTDKCLVKMDSILGCVLHIFEI